VLCKSGKRLSDNGKAIAQDLAPRRFSYSTLPIFFTAAIKRALCSFARQGNPISCVERGKIFSL
jgi:hypothetical protein